MGPNPAFERTRRQVASFLLSGRWRRAAQLWPLAVMDRITIEPSAWRYVGSADSARIAALANALANSELPSALRLGLTLNCFHREPRGDDATDERAVFCGTVDAQLFDWFFNARTGYRGAFYEAQDIGIRANRNLIDHLAAFLVGWISETQPGVDCDWIHSSLSKPSAKAWLAEYPGLCASCAGEWSSTYVSELQIANGRWETSSNVHASWGRQAPRLSKVRILGGFIDGRGNEWLASHKVGRAEHIWEHGWS